MSLWPKGVLSIMLLGQVRECPRERLREYFGKSPRTKVVLNLMLLGQVRVYLRGFERVLRKLSLVKLENVLVRVRESTLEILLGQKESST